MKLHRTPLSGLARLTLFVSLAAPGASTAFAQAASTTVSPPADDEVVELSPFEVNTTRDRGYYASSSLSGTRLNTDLRDLASSVTVVTKTQLIDTAALDINDVFLNEANTEGMLQYTEYVQDRSFYNETTTLAPQTANRIRGVGRANPARDGFASSTLIPLDTYNIDNIEISRGPNANIFGLGEASGTVNTNIIRADASRQFAQVMVRGDSVGGWRTQLDVNQPLWKDKVGIRVAAVHDEKGFERDPAYEDIDRLTAALTIKPFRKTTIVAKYESFNDAYSRANTTLPRDSFSEWQRNGMPVWNPTIGTTGGWRYMNSPTYTEVAVNNEQAQLPLGFVANNTGFWNSPSAYVVNGQIERYEMSRANNSLTAPGVGGQFRLAQTGDIIRRGGNTLGYPPLILFQSHAITDKSLYDYESINFLATNYGVDRADIYTGLLEQEFFRNDRHALNFQVGYYREQIGTHDRNFLSKSDGGTPYVTIDINEVLLDGSPNPYFLRPYIGASQPRISWRNEVNEHARANLAYEFDFRKNDGWSRWLGLHRLLGYGEFRESYVRSLTGGDRNLQDYTWTSANDASSYGLRGNSYRMYPRFYVGGKVTDAGPIIDYAPLPIQNLSEVDSFTWYGTNRAKVTEPANLAGFVTGGNATLRQIRSKGVVWQGYFWDGKIVPTLGWREDRQREIAARSLNANNPATNPSSTVDPNTRFHDFSYLKVFPGPWIENSGETKTAGIVVHALPWLSFHANVSDSFKPEPIRYNIHLDQVPNPTGEGKDYGVTFNLFDGKLVAKLNRYELEEKNSRSGATSGAFAARTFRFFFDADTVLNWNPANQTFDSSDDPWDLEQMGAQWYMSANPTADPQQAIAFARETYLAPFGFDPAFIDRVRDIGLGGFAEVNTVISKGYELELSYNPTPYWTMKLTGAQQQAIDSELSHNISGFFAENLEALKAITIPTNPFTTNNGTAGRQWWSSGATSATSTATPQNFYFQNILTTLRQAAANEGKPRPQTREYSFAATTSYQFKGITDHRWLKNVTIGGSLRWADQATLGYYGLPSTDPDVKGAIVEYDISRPIYDDPQWSLDLMAAYEFRMYNDRVRCRVQLNVQNALEDGSLRPFVYNPDGTPWNFRIIDPRRFVLSATFSL